MTIDNKAYINAQLYEKVCKEMKVYESELLSLPAEEILERSYAYATKQDIVLALEEHDLSEEQAIALIECDNALEAIFDRWENTESDYMEHIRDMIDCTANEKRREKFLKEKREKQER